jgi:hypothetical protein
MCAARAMPQKPSPKPADAPPRRNGNLSAKIRVGHQAPAAEPPQPRLDANPKISAMLVKHTCPTSSPGVAPISAPAVVVKCGKQESVQSNRSPPPSTDGETAQAIEMQMLNPIHSAAASGPAARARELCMHMHMHNFWRLHRPPNSRRNAGVFAARQA